MRNGRGIAVTLRSETGGVSDYKEYPAGAHVEAEPWDGRTEVWIESGADLVKVLAADGGTVEIAGV